MKAILTDYLQAGNQRYDRERALQEERIRASAQAKLEELSRIAKRKASDVEPEQPKPGSGKATSSSSEGNRGASEPLTKRTKKNKKGKRSKKARKQQEDAAE